MCPVLSCVYIVSNTRTWIGNIPIYYYNSYFHPCYVYSRPVYSIKKQLQKIGEGSRDGNAKKYSNKGGRDDNKYNRHPYSIVPGVICSFC